MPFDQSQDWTEDDAARFSSSTATPSFSATQAERDVLGSILRRPELLDYADGMTGAHFEAGPFGVIVDEVARKHAANLSSTIESLEPFLAQANNGRGIGLTTDDLQDFADNAPNPGPRQFAALACAVREAAEKRAIYNAVASDLVGFMLEHRHESPAVWAQELERVARGLDVGGSGGAIVTARDAIREALAEMRNPAARIKTGIRDLDAQFLGFRRGHNSLIAAATGGGKTGKADNLFYNMGKAGLVVHYCSMEMGSADLGTRLLSAASYRARGESGGITYEDMFSDGPRVYAEHGDFLETLVDAIPTTLHIEKSGPQHFDKLAQQARATKRRFGGKLDVVIVDHVGLMAGVLRKGSLYERTTDISNQAKQFAKSLDVAVICLTQVNREPSKRSGFRANIPSKSDLRDSGALEQDADSVLGLHYEYAWMQERGKPDASDPEFFRWDDDEANFRNTLEVKVLKQRGGRFGHSVFLDYRPGFDIIGNADQKRLDYIRERIRLSTKGAASPAKKPSTRGKGSK